MLKLVGATLVVAATGLGGMAVAGNYTRRPRELRSIRSALKMLETEIAYGATYLTEALEQVAERCDEAAAPLFKNTASELGSLSGVTVMEAWEKSLALYYPGTALKERDVSALFTLGAYLGMSDREDQIKHLKLAMEQMDAETTAAEEEAVRNVKLWSYLGFLGGLVIVLVLY